ncbi:MAG: hypothetical protein RL020_691 [Pseudomonadota bacterium]|jgi:hypothetical protein
MKYFKYLIFCLLSFSCAAQAQTAVNATIGGVFAPGVYGQVSISNGVIPPLIYAQPVIIAPVAVAPPPIYMNVPPGHAKKWRKHCHKYNACGTPVYFVQANYAGPQGYPVQPVYVGQEGKKHGNRKHKHDDDDREEGRQHGKHKDKD